MHKSGEVTGLLKTRKEDPICLGHSCYSTGKSFLFVCWAQQKLGKWLTEFLESNWSQILLQFWKSPPTVLFHNLRLHWSCCDIWFYAVSWIFSEASCPLSFLHQRALKADPMDVMYSSPCSQVWISPCRFWISALGSVCRADAGTLSTVVSLSSWKMAQMSGKEGRTSHTMKNPLFSECKKKIFNDNNNGNNNNNSNNHHHNNHKKTSNISDFCLYRTLTTLVSNFMLETVLKKNNSYQILLPPSLFTLWFPNILVMFNILVSVSLT